MQKGLDITLPSIHMEEILKTQNIDKEKIKELFNVEDTEIFDYKRSVPPKYRINFYRLEQTGNELNSSDNKNNDSDLVSFPVNEDSRIDLVINKDKEKIISYNLFKVKSSLLWDLKELKKVDILSCGRFKTNDFLPVICDIPLNMDLGVSREHALICCYESKLFYIDYGTSQKHKGKPHLDPDHPTQTHFGSKNGSWLYKSGSIVECIKNKCVEWEAGSDIGIGTFFYNILIYDKHLKLFHQFSFDFEIL